MSVPRAVSISQRAILAGLTEVVGAGLHPERPSPDPELTARMLQALSDEAARLLLTDPGGHSVERLMAHAGWLIEQLSQ